MRRGRSQRSWLRKHLSDPYVKRATAQGYRSRAAYKLIEINQKYNIMAGGMTVIDLGAAPGGWSQVACEIVGQRGRVIAVDLLEMKPIPGVDYFQGDIYADSTIARIKALCGQAKANVVISDMAPNLSGVALADQAQAVDLIDKAYHVAEQVLGQDGVLLTKVFHGTGFETCLEKLKQQFKKVVCSKPSASKSRSREVYLLARGYTKKRPTLNSVN